ncbi:beta strand repeat-containing protein [Usitatibacter palustris]|uniref:Right handed beta helix region n=1 Tax=Usitatibacter palustris TaxID=2732487 RepID=A0A6M4HER9_9PROT|nr:hypothetical protein [Usitatibacter palustris]QJR16517.1 hypothetical protein DSM104440_03352 [Usitatibacter palustris]
MFRWIAPVVGALLGLGALNVQAQTCNTTINPGNDITLTIQGMTSGQVLCLNPGNYTPPPGFPSNGSFAVGVGVIVRGLGATPLQTTLTASNGADHALYFTNYLTTKNANGAQLINLTITGTGGVQVQNFTAAPAGRLTDIKLKDVMIFTNATAGPFFGVKTQNADRIVLDNVQITSHNTAINFIDTTDSLVMNSTVTNTVAVSAAALSVLGGSGNRFINSTFGQPRVSAGAAYSFNGGGVVFYNTSDNRFEGNTVQGMQADAVAFTIFDLSPNGLPLTKSLNNYAGRNQVLHSAFPINGLTAGSSGIWSNCASDGTWVYGNTVTGSGEGGLTIFEGRNNMFLGNVSFNHGLLGTYISGDQTAMNDCTPAGNTTFRQKPNNNFIISNANLYNPLEQVVVRDADNTVLQRNFSSPTAGLGGPTQACTFATCQASFSLETDGTAGRNTNAGTRLIANTSIGTQRGLWTQNTTPNSVTGLAFYLNRTIGSGSSLYETPVTHFIDGFSVVGGNYWTNFSPSGNPSATPYNGVAHNTVGGTGNVVDRFPYQSENLGRGFGVVISEPRAGAAVAIGSQRTLRWDAPGCSYVTFTLGGQNLVVNTPNTGYAVVTIPAIATGANNVVATCKDAAGTVRGTTSNGPTFNVMSANLKIVSPGRDDVFNTTTSVWVAWSNPSHLTPVTVDVSSDGGASWGQVASIAGISASNPVTSTRVNTPAAGTANAIFRVRSGGTTATNCGGVTNCDEMDGVFAVRGATGAFDALNLNAGRTLQVGAVERIEWSSPQTSRLVTITAVSSGGGGVVTVATDLPDRGFFDWVMPDFPIGTISLTANFKTNTGAAVGAPVTIVNGGSIRRLQTITYGTIPTVVPGGSAPITVTTNSGQAVTLTSQTPGVCTVTGNTINGISNGVCTITGNVAANGNYSAASPSVISFNVGLSQTITFNSTAYIGVTKSITLSATANSGLTVTFTSLTPGICTISGGNVLTANSSGTCTVAADQPGNGTYAAAPQVQRNLQAMATILLPRLANLSTRGFVGSGGDVMIAGLIIGGPTAKTVVVTVAGPSLSGAGIPNPLANPTLTLIRSSDGVVVGSNDNWQQAANAAQIQSAGFAPAHPAEPAVMMTLAPGAYTAVVQASGGVGTGIGLVGVYEVAEPEVPLINISTRGFVGTGNDVMIAGLIVQGSNTQSVVITVAGPSLAGAGIPNPLNNPMITIVRASDGVVIATNDNWQTQTNPGDVTLIQNAGFAPAHPNEPAVYLTLPPGAYTAIVQGVSSTTGVGLVGVYAVAQ